MEGNMKRVVSLLSAAAIMVTLCAGCDRSGDENSNNGVKPMTSVEFQDIVYQKTANEFKEDSKITIQPESPGYTGDVVKANLRASVSTSDPYYYIVDWGDGTWSYNGPYMEADGVLTHVYKKAGEYQVRGMGINLSTGAQVGWSKAGSMRITGEDVKTENYISNVTPISSSDADKEHAASKVMDNDSSTFWKSKNAEKPVDEVYIGYEFDTIYRLDTIEFQVPADAAIWPSEFSVEYTTDRGETWNMLPKYYYLYPHMEKENNPYGYWADQAKNMMNFINPKGATIVLPLDGIVANGIRIVNKSFSLSQLQADKYMEVSELRVTGDRETLFYSSLGGTFDADLNNMWTIFGSGDTEPAVKGTVNDRNPDPYRSGCRTIGSTEWLEWDGMQNVWRTGNDAMMSIYYSTLFNSYVGPDGWSDNPGYVYPTTATNSTKHLGDQNHYVYNQILILAARNYLLTTAGESNLNNVEAFMNKRNPSGQTMEYRLDKAMDYLLTTLEGESGVLTILDPDNDGTPDGVASNYWDVMKCCGYKSSYENVYFYRSLFAMADILNFRADRTKDEEKAAEYRERAQYYLDVAAKVKVKFNETFWDEEKGRYITSINVKGVKLDFGLTFVNFMAAAAGLPDEDQAKKIYEWIDGDRIIEGEASTGEDILGHFKYSARANTVDFSTVKDENGKYYWWDHNGAMPCLPDTLGGYGNQMQNGGTIFYISYYELQGRLRNLGADNAFERFQEILNEFHVQDQLRVFPLTQYGGYVSGVIGEFPESGLVPLTFLDSFLGVTSDDAGLKVTPNLPSDMTYAGVREYHFNTKTYSIKVDKELTAPACKQLDDKGTSWYVELPADGTTWVITRDNQIVAYK